MQTVTPVPWALESLALHRAGMGRVALLVPTSPALLSLRDATTPGLILGGITQHLQHSVHDGLRAIARSAPDLVIVHSDQLFDPSVANVLVLQDGNEAYISSVEYLLNSKYGYSLRAWLGTEWAGLAPGADMEDVARLVLAHLQACASLGDLWPPASAQHHRMRHARDALRDRRLRFVRSSIANAYAGAPGSGVVRTLAVSLSAIERRCKERAPE